MTTRADRFSNFRHVYMRSSPQVFLHNCLYLAIPIRRALCGVGPSFTAARTVTRTHEQLVRELTDEEYAQQCMRDYDELIYKGD